MMKNRPFRSIKEVEAYVGGLTVECLLCGRQFQNLSRHLSQTHQCGQSEYRQRFNIPAKYPLAGAALSEKRRAVGKRPEHAAHIARQRAKHPRTAPMNKMVAATRRAREPFEDFSWHLHEARTVYERVEPPEGTASWRTFKRRCAVDPELRAAFHRARMERSVPRETEWARKTKRWGGQRIKVWDALADGD